MKNLLMIAVAALVVAGEIALFSNHPQPQLISPISAVTSPTPIPTYTPDPSIIPPSQ